MMSRILILDPCSQQPTCADPENFLGGGGLALDHGGSDSFTISKPIPWEIEGGWGVRTPGPPLWIRAWPMYY